jgi:hypothetical protein
MDQPTRRIRKTVSTTIPVPGRDSHLVNITGPTLIGLEGKTWRMN